MSGRMLVSEMWESVSYFSEYQGYVTPCFIKYTNKYTKQDYSVYISFKNSCVFQLCVAVLVVYQV